MSIVGVIATKGGAGKSTVAVHLAIAAALKKRRPLIIDFDAGQNSIYIWSKSLRKKKSSPAVQRATLDTLEATIEAAERGKYDLIIIDVAAGGGTEVRRVATIADHILVPVTASTFDLAATRNTMDLLKETVDNSKPDALALKNSLGKAAIVVNYAPPRATARWRQELEAALDTCGAGGVEIIGTLSDREAYSTAIEHGLGVTEDREDKKAVEEILDLYAGLARLEGERAEKLKRVRGRR